MVRALRSFRDEADWALVYFAVHGIEIDHVNYLIPVDAKLSGDRDVTDETVSYEPGPGRHLNQSHEISVANTSLAYGFPLITPLAIPSRSVCCWPVDLRLPS
jgi:uncharacterized caspase-like protein